MSEEILAKNQKVDAQLREVLSPEGSFVAVKFLTSLEGFEKIKSPRSPRALCQLISQVRYIGRTVLLPKGDYQSCYLGNYVLGFKELAKDAWKRYEGWQMASAEAAEKTFATLPHLEMGKYQAVLLTPLGRCPVEPDSVVFSGNASQVLVVAASYLHNRGGAVTSQITGMAGCAEATVAPMLYGKPMVTVPGNAWKLLAGPSNTDIICGIPGNLLQEMADNAAFMRVRGGSRYPAAWQHIDWDVQPPIGDLLTHEGKASWVKK